MVKHRTRYLHNGRMGRPKLEPGTAGAIEIVGLYLGEGGRWQAYTDANPQPKRWESVARWRARAYYRGHDGMRGEVSRIIEGGRRKALVMSEATEVVGRALDQRLTELASGDVTEGILVV